MTPTHGEVTLNIGGEVVDLKIEAPGGPTTVQEMLPILQGLTDVYVTLASEKAEAQGRAVSCRPGCAACCRQVVPVAHSEARALARLVEAMPEPRRSQVQARFEAVEARLEAEGLIARIETAQADGDDELHEVGMDYFRLGMACPFLEAEHCSIHPSRPMACREYLVTSPAENCAEPAPELIDMVELAAQPSVALIRAEAKAGGGGWTPLALALRFARTAPPEAAERPAPEILGDVIGRPAA